MEDTTFLHVKKVKCDSLKISLNHEWEKIQQRIKKGIYSLLQKCRTYQCHQAGGTKIVAANWHITKCFPEILQEMNERELMLHHYIAYFHVTRFSVEILLKKVVSVFIMMMKFVRI